MKNKYLLSLLWVIVSGFGILMAQEIAIIPQPAHLIVKNESFKFGKQLKVCIASYRGDSVTLVFDSFKILGSIFSLFTFTFLSRYGCDNSIACLTQ